MKAFLLTLYFLLFFINTYSQTSKGNWLVGGQISFSSEKKLLEGQTSSSKIFQLSPAAAYFFINNLAVGLKTSYYTGRAETDYTNLSIGPFIRGYFLPPDERVNIFAQGDYQFGTYFDSSTLSLSAGPVIYFHSNVGIEFTVGYSTTSFKYTDVKNTSILAGIGLQVHLKRK